MGREMADAEGIRVETLIIDDDVSVKDSTYTVGRRGVAGNFFVIKAVGAAAEEGAELDDLVALGKRVNDVTRTMGMALTACTPPAKGSPCSSWATTRWRWASASTASPAAAARSWPAPTRSSTSCWTRSSPTSPTSRATRWR
jgi:hypothetical protein